MSRRAAIVEVDDFDDDTDLPLPSHPLPNTGARGPLLQELHISDDEFEQPSQRAGPASPPAAQPAFRTPPGVHSKNTVTDITPYKNWTCVYPIYLDAKRSYGTGQRRVPRARALWWPLSKDIAEATNALGLATLHEVDKSHPRDWENPGRVRVQWKKDGRLMNPAIRTKKHLLESIALRIHQAKPAAPAPPTPSPSASSPSASPPAPSSGKGKQPSAPAPKKPAVAPASATANVKSKSKPPAKAHRTAPTPPLPLPPLAARVSPYSPALASGVLVDAVKAGMAAQAQEAAQAPVGAAPGQPGGAGAGKGKRKVVRVRG
ncbi:signal recognition particle, SRP19 subunit [Mycena belliarum]|uniref:Signal recognition particle, SRP19 subunit n=1 Tax=Mycena belliarum TaxID=1033014 RepID=A0AAD6XUU1_9AGAR|nr:signal recognition particle, SRP19 subunit [Mycena belliae]